ncbi:MAG: hypothetical protein CVU42_08930 [Chloroflexi bacterium HGW-Chloroflexi-4]|jgi:hypothetical protein|nr:MAG: hypothetical protein CVU42_08930 [Chloroflexi bacterium HGW-Chloroflexi-4]
MNKYNLDYAIYTKNNDSIEKILNSTSSLILKAKCLASMGQVSESIKILDYLDLDLMTVPEKQQFFESRLLIASQS